MQKKPDLGVQFVSSEIVNAEDETSAAIVHSPCLLDRISNSKLEKKTDNFFIPAFFISSTWSSFWTHFCPWTQW